MKRPDLPEILPTHTPALFEEAVRRVVALLRAGQVAVLPTETVYGLAANAFDPVAVRKIFQIKARPANNPIIVHVATLEMARSCASGWPSLAEALATAFWPGPLTLVVPRSERIPTVVTAGGPTVGLRWPRHPFIQEVIRACGFPLAAPSANPASQISPTHPEHARKALGAQVPLIVDGGPCPIGIESTVLDLATRPPRILRPGMIGPASLLAVTGELAGPAGPEGIYLRSPGLLSRHYAPKARLYISAWANEHDLAREVSRLKGDAPSTCIIAHSQIPSPANYARVAVIPHDPEAFARAIYAELHACDEAGARLIVVEALPRTEAWSAITDRLERAAIGLS
jgi:L-threonylcarbamoyladenylate synthase